MPLLVDTGHSSRTRQHDTALKACRMELPRVPAEDNQLALFALADGLPGRPDPERAAHTAVQIFFEGCRAAPEVWPPLKLLTESYAAANQFLAASDNQTLAASLSALVLHQRHWLLGHAGDTRVWLFRGNQLKLLTRDSVTPSLQPTPQFSKAVGLAPVLEPDQLAGETAEGDIFLMTSSGAHAALDSTVIMSCLMGDASAQQMAEMLTQRAQATANIASLHACVVRVERLPRKGPPADEPAMLAMIAAPMIGDTVDGYRIEELIQKSSRYRLYRATGADGKNVILKFPSPKFGADAGFTDDFLRQEWIARRLDSPYLVRALPPGNTRRTALYSVLAWHPGENLSERAKRKHGLPLGEALMLARQLLDVLAVLRSAGVAHPDIRLKNLLYDKQNSRLLLLNPGASLLGHRSGADGAAQASSGALSYLAPELLEGRDAGARSDVYTTGVAFYRMLTGKYPYGMIKSVNHAAFGEMDTAAARKANVPPWLADILSRACAFDPDNRYAGAAAFARALADGETRAAQAPAPAPAAATPAPARRFAAWEWVLVGTLLAGLVSYLVLALF